MRHHAFATDDVVSQWHPHNPNTEITMQDNEDRRNEKSEMFLVGRLDKRGQKVVFVNEPASAPFPGPWELHAVFTC